MTSSNDDSTGGKKSNESNVIDLRDRLPAVMFGEHPAGKLAAELMKVISKGNELAYEQIAALMMVSHTIQNVLRHGHNASEEDLTHIMERAIEITDNTRIRIELKQEKPK